MNNFFIVVNGQKYGSYTKEMIATFIREGRIDSETPCWYEGLPQWVPLKTVFPDLFGNTNAYVATSNKPNIQKKKKKFGCFFKLSVAAILIFLFVFIKGKVDYYRDTKTPDFPKIKTEDVHISGNLKKIEPIEKKIENSKPQTLNLGDVKVNIPVGFKGKEVEFSIVKGIQIENGELLAQPVFLQSDANSDFEAPVEIEFPMPASSFKNKRLLCVAVNKKGEVSYPFIFGDNSHKKLKVLTEHFTVFAPVFTKNKHKYSPVMQIPFSAAYRQVRLSQDRVDNIFKNYRKDMRYMPRSALSDFWSVFNEQFGIDTTLTSFAENALYAEGFTKFNKYIPEVGLGLAFVQLGIDMYNGDNISAAGNLTKSLSYYAIGKKFPTRAMNIAMAGVFVIDYSLNKFATEAWSGRKEIYYQMNQRWIKNRMAKGENGEWWFHRLDKVILANMQTPDKIPVAIENSFESYAKELWGNDEEIAYWQSQVMKKTNFTGGGGLSEDLREELIKNLKEMLKQYNSAVISTLSRKYLKRIRENAVNSRKRIIKFLNKKHRITLRVVNEKGKLLKGFGGKKIGLKISSKEKQKFWVTKVNKAGVGYLFCTNLGYVNAGFPKKAFLEIEGGKEPVYVFTKFRLKDTSNINVDFVIESKGFEGVWKGSYRVTEVPFKKYITDMVAKGLLVSSIAKDKKDAYNTASSMVTEEPGLRNPQSLHLDITSLGGARYKILCKITVSKKVLKKEIIGVEKNGSLIFKIPFGNLKYYFNGRMLRKGEIIGEYRVGHSQSYAYIKGKWEMKKIGNKI